MFILIENINKKNYNYFKIAPIGTKSHAIAVILATIYHPKKIEIIYDNPIRKTKRTTGYGNIIVCNITSLTKDLR